MSGIEWVNKPSNSNPVGNRRFKRDRDRETERNEEVKERNTGREKERERDLRRLSGV